MGRLALLVEVVLNNSEPKPPAVVAMGARVLEGTWWRAESGARGGGVCGATWRVLFARRAGDVITPHQPVCHVCHPIDALFPFGHHAPSACSLVWKRTSQHHPLLGGKDRLPDDEVIGIESDEGGFQTGCAG